MIKITNKNNGLYKFIDVNTYTDEEMLKIQEFYSKHNGYHYEVVTKAIYI